MRRVLLLSLLIALLGAPAADAASLTVVRGGGFGHGVGMSQYGAYGYALHGAGYRQILAHYYPGTRLSPAPTRTIRVLLAAGARSYAFSGASRLLGGRALDPGHTYAARRVDAGTVALLDSSGAELARSPAPLRLAAASGVLRLAGPALNGVRDGAYRGSLELRPAASGGLLAVNAVGLDDYVAGVVAGEMPASWPLAALAAQSVAARSYALATDAGGAAFDQYPDTRSQVYGGISAEDRRASAAVRATAGRVLRYRGRVATTFFFSTSGGRTEDVQNVFGGSAVPYLSSVDDPYDGVSPRHQWTLSFTDAQMQARLAGLVKGTYRGIEVVQRGASPRILWADVVGSDGTTRVRGTVLRARLGLFDTWASFSAG